MASKRNRVLKRYIKLLETNPDPVLNLSSLRAAPDNLIKTICNAAYNLTSNESVKLSPKQKKYFRKYKSPISKLIERGPSIRQKRSVLVQPGGGLFIPALLSAVLPIVGSLIGNVIRSG